MSSFLRLKWLSTGFSVFYVILAMADLAVTVSWYVDGIKTGLVNSWLNYNRLLEVLIGMGFLLSIVGFCGCFASLNDYLRLLILSTVSVVLIACGFASIAVYLSYQLPVAETGLQENMVKTIGMYDENINM